MKSPSKQRNSQEMYDEDKLKQTVNEQLDNSINRLEKNTLADIVQARSAALSKLAEQAEQSPYMPLFSRVIDRLSSNQTAPWLIPSAAALIIAISVNYLSVEAIPELPLALMAGELPTEDLALLEDLEFLTWLAKNEMDAVL